METKNGISNNSMLTYVNTIKIGLSQSPETP